MTACVMNFITFQGAYSLYPMATFEYRKALTIGEVNVDAYTKYTARRWTLYDDLAAAADAMSLFFFYDRVRRIMDSKTWVTPFNIDNITLRSPTTQRTTPIVWDPTLPNSWLLPRTSLTGRSIKYSVISYPVLEHKYLVGNPRAVRHITATLSAIHRNEKRKQDASLNGGEWKFWDDQYPAICKEFDIVDKT